MPPIDPWIVARLLTIYGAFSIIVLSAQHLWGPLASCPVIVAGYALTMWRCGGWAALRNRVAPEG